MNTMGFGVNGVNQHAGKMKETKVKRHFALLSFSPLMAYTGKFAVCFLF